MNQDTAAQSPRRDRTSRIRSIVTAVALAAVAVVTVTVHAQDRGGHWGGPDHGDMFDGPGPRMGHMLDRMLDGLGATDAQRAQIKQIAQAAAQDLHKQHEAEHALRQREVQLLAAPSVDAAAAESVRQQMLALHDQSSKRMLQAMLDAGKVLTPEQRAKIGARMQEREAIWKERREREQRMHHEHPRE